MSGIFSEMSKEEERRLVLNELAITKELIAERKHPLDLLRELLSNAVAKEVAAKHITISYAVNPDFGHCFTFVDDGCGMNCTRNLTIPGRLDRFLSLGYSGIVGLQSDEFSWKGLGSKLAFQSRRLEVETWDGGAEAYRVLINEPWETITRGDIPNAKIGAFRPDSLTKRGTRIVVSGHPPFPDDKIYSMDQIRDYLANRTVAGFTRTRECPPEIQLKTPAGSILIGIGFPALARLEEIRRANSPDTILVEQSFDTNIPGTNKALCANIKGFHTLDGTKFGLVKGGNNTGLILSVKGIPYFPLGFTEFAGRGGLAITPGESNCCLIVECDALQEEMNISRSDLNDSAGTRVFKTRLAKWFEDYQSKDTYQAFRQFARTRKKTEQHEKGARRLGATKDRLLGGDQDWVVLAGPPVTRLHRVPANECDTLAILWKLEALKKLPFHSFETLAHQGQGADLLVNLQEDPLSEPERCISVEAEYLFTNFRKHGHHAPQMPTVICWDLGPSPKTRIRATEGKPFRFTTEIGDTQVRIFTLKRMEGIRIEGGKIR